MPIEATARVVVPARSQLIDSAKKAFFIIGSGIFVFVAARNTVTWHAQQFWGASGDFWQRQFDRSYELFGGTDFSVGFLGTLIITFCWYWLLSLFLIYVDVSGKPAFLLRYKIQPDKNTPVDKEKLWKAVKTVMFNLLVVSPIFGLIAYKLMQFRGCQFSGELPTLHWALLELCVFILVEEVLFYYSHRLFHTPRLYKHIHKMHHEWTAPISIISLYAHPIEHFFSNTLPPAAGPLLMGSHISTAWVWYCLAIASTINAHCGYHFPFFPSPEAHDFHHLKFVNNFGVLGVLDRLHGTDNIFRRTKAYDRHLMMLTIVPPRELYPEMEKKNNELSPETEKEQQKQK